MKDESDFRKQSQGKSCLVKLLIGLAVLLIGMPVAALVVVIPVLMVLNGDYKVVCTLISIILLLSMLVSGIAGFRKAFCEDSEYYLHGGSSDLLQSALIGALNIFGLTLLGAAMFHVQTPAWIAIPGAGAFLLSLAWACRCVKVCNAEIRGKQLVLATSGRMFLISLVMAVSVVMVATVVALRDVLKAKGSKASVRIHDALEYNLKAVRIWGRNLGDGEVVRLLALLGIFVFLGQKLWLIVEATRNEFKPNVFTAFTYGICNLACAVAVYFGSVFLIKQVEMKPVTEPKCTEQAEITDMHSADCKVSASAGYQE